MPTHSTTKYTLYRGIGNTHTMYAPCMLVVYVYICMKYQLYFEYLQSCIHMCF